ncbi:hypothetical protein CCGE525_17700 [Rhizobium jaguaris]|uniref:Uncharacterized protein n=1 Tax=Rhizobium jaguaris TaxID=1312183 RepID=A0A387FNQ5_9HYPH|nr:hypothetical protein CCGE525_17700 [Rhizobium jaguaris]
MMRSLILVAATLFNCVVMANEMPPPGFDPGSVPERLRVLIHQNPIGVKCAVTCCARRCA